MAKQLLYTDEARQKLLAGVQKLGAGEILLTSMDCDGTREGYDIELTRAVSSAVRIPVIASGGAGKVEHFYDALTTGVTPRRERTALSSADVMSMSRK